MEIEVRVGNGGCLELFDVAGTVAYDGRGRPAGWHVRITVEEGGRLHWSGQPFIVADGADVVRTLSLDLAATASAVLRETLVLGRSGQRGGRVRNRTAVRVSGAPVLLEDQLLDPNGVRTLPGVLGEHRVLDTLLVLGEEGPAAAPAVRFTLHQRAGTVTRYIGHNLAASPLHAQIGRQDPTLCLGTG